MKSAIFTILTLTLSALSIEAHDFTTTDNNGTLYFKITSVPGQTVQVTYPGSITDSIESPYSGRIEIPDKVQHEGIVYTVTAIGNKAFANATDLTSIIIPSTVTRIGDFAFEGCTNLKSVVFPGSQPETGQGTFFRCTGIESITIGSDWQSIDLAMFRWSDSLKHISFPAKVSKIQNLKKLKGLQTVSVDPNNNYFQSINGDLYSHDGKTLYAVPRAAKGTITVAEGTTSITKDALIDCTAITRIIFPDSIKTFSFRETSRMTNLTEVVFKGNTPPLTAVYQGTEIFLLMTAGQNVAITIAKDSKTAFSDALAVQAGDYTEIGEPGVPYVVSQSQIPSASNLNPVKKIQDYE